jgi:lipopolysaccharide biosynthesis glycosyltransferase
MKTIPVYIGYDPRERAAYHACSESIISNSSLPVSITPVYLPQLKNYVESHTDGSNQFIYSRFLVPWMSGYSGWAIFLDGDMVVKGDIAELWEQKDQWQAVQVVKHDYKTKHPGKYLGNKNEDYPRKNWSSVMLINCQHFAWRQLTPEFVSKATGEFLHRFQFIPDDKIGELGPEWNWLVEEYEHNDQAKLLHYTIGIPAFSEYVRCDHSEDWWGAFRDMTYCENRRSGDGQAGVGINAIPVADPQSAR